ncbi:MAG: SH3 domain-containing protein [Clostridia bacterium]|nr:SH3 domain-containing protein [Clostridia bacterium]
MPSIYLSPSTQEFNKYYDGSGSEEYYMNLIADAMEPYLISSGISYTRNNRYNTVRQAIEESNAGNYDLHLALHSNASPESLSGQLSGSDFYYYTRSRRGREAATILADNFMSIYPNPSAVKIVPTTSLAEVVRTTAPAVLAELAYHDNVADAEWIKNNINEIARNLVQGVAEFLGVLFVSPNEYSGVRRGIVTTAGGRLNVRERPNLEANILTQIPNGETVDVYCTTGLWYVVEHNGILGFASAQYIDIPNS